MKTMNGFLNNKRRMIMLFFAIVVVASVLIYQIISINNQVRIENDDIPRGDLAIITGKELSLVPNNPSEATNNVNKLIFGINSGKKVIIDDIYYMGRPTRKLSSFDVSIGGTAGGQMIFNFPKSMVLFDTSKIKSFSLESVSVTNQSKSPLLMVYSGNLLTTTMESFYVDACKFEGNISLLRYFGDYNVDPTTYGIEKFILKNSTISNTKSSFVVINDTVTDTEVTDNTIKNFDLIFFNHGITNNTINTANLGTYGTVLFSGNKVFNDDSWWGTTGSTLYHCFVLYEGANVVYTNNNVEGLKVNKETALYDAYLSAGSVEYTNNVWKNNIGFYPNKNPILNSLLKSKSGVGSSMKRVYSNNTFIVEEGYAAKLGYPKEYLTVGFMNLNKAIDYYEITGNTIDVYDIVFQPSSVDVKDYIISDNTIDSKIATGNIMIMRLSDDVSSRTANFSNNKISIGQLNPQYGLTLIKTVNSGSNDNQLAELTVKNNVISGPFTYIFYDVKAALIDMGENDSNQFNVSADTFKRLGYKTDNLILNEVSGEELIVTQ